jgi:hypothetical protein
MPDSHIKSLYILQFLLCIINKVSARLGFAVMDWHKNHIIVEKGEALYNAEGKRT